ncbi:MAG: putative ABC transporter ATP-binding protein YheS [Alphaproteobacteria bacterium ADurb.Bin438]|nr:MAG: putative ABC transporter ATP-binding protein YheS [Alphaproteobacteria bacterium ADurb.Bin438]
MQSEALKFETKRKHLQSFIDRFRYKASKAKQAQSRIKMLEKLGDAPTLPKDFSISFDFPSPLPLPPPLLTLSKANAGYGEKVIIRNINLRLDQDDRIAIIGANGNGKSTLAKVLSDNLQLLSGEMDKSNKLKVAYFAQHMIEFLDVEKTPYEILSSLMPKAKETEVRNHLGRFGLQAEKAVTLVKNLSGGEKARLELSIITKDAPHILILDEPTNHLDIDSREALTEALNNYEGAVILITHDLSMIELVSDRLWLVENGSCKEFEGSIDDYKEIILNRNDDEEKKEKVKKEVKIKPKSLPKNTISKVEKEIEELEKLKTMLEEKLSISYNDKIQAEYANTIEKLNELEEKWLTLNGA